MSRRRPTDLRAPSTCEAAQAIRAGEITFRALVEACQERIETSRTAQVQGDVRAIASCDAAYTEVEDQIEGYDSILTPA